MRENVVVSWSGGKDSCLALQEILASQRYEVATLLTTVTRDDDRISMHGVRRALLERQAEALSLPLKLVYISKGARNDEYEAQFKNALAVYRASGIETIVFGDLFLEDIRRYREQQLVPPVMNSLFPVWKRDTSALIRSFVDVGFQAVTVCVNAKQLDPSFVGRSIDAEFLAQLPPGVDPCGEYGEFHSFVYDGPLFKEKVNFKMGPVSRRDGFCFQDLLPE